MTRTELRFSGFGGQGVITMAHILGRAATIHADMDATLTEAYGPEKTGGFSRGDVVVSDEPIDFPLVTNPDVVVCFSQDAYERDAHTVAPYGLVIIDRDLVSPENPPDQSRADLIKVPAVEIAGDLGRKVVANIAMLGAVVSIIGTPPKDAVRTAVTDVVPQGTEELNVQAFDRGTTARTQEAPQ